MDDFIVSGEYGSYVYAGHAAGNSEQEREDPTTRQRVKVKVPYCNVYVIQPVSDYVSEDYQGFGMKAMTYKCLNQECLESLLWKIMKAFSGIASTIPTRYASHDWTWRSTTIPACSTFPRWRAIRSIMSTSAKRT